MHRPNYNYRYNPYSSPFSQKQEWYGGPFYANQYQPVHRPPHHNIMPPNHAFNPVHQQQPPRPKQGLQNLLYHFKTKDGQLDFEKMFHTANQVTNTVKQISPLFQMFYPKK